MRIFEAKTGAWDLRMAWALPRDPDSRILDLGCGSGSLLYWLHKRGFTQAEGIDISPEVVAQATGSGVSNVHCADAQAWLKEHDSEYDLVFLRDVLEHFSLEEGMDLLTQVRNGLRPEGRIVLQVPNAESPLVGRVRWGDLTHEGAYTPGSMSQLLTSMGFAIETVRPVEPALCRPRTMHRFVLWKFVEFFHRVIGYAEGAEFGRVVTQNMLVAARKMNA